MHAAHTHEPDGADRIVDVAIVGAGNMGRNHARVLSRLPGARVAAVVDPDVGGAATELAAEHRVRAFGTIDDLDVDVHAAIIATPSTEHHPIGVRLLERGIDVLVEKPMASSVREARELVETADRRGRILAIGHTERFNPVCIDLPRYVTEPIFIQARRLSALSDRTYDGVIADMMIHDIDLVLTIARIDDDPISVTAESLCPRSQTEDLATATLRWESGLVAQLTASRVSQEKTREFEILQPDSVVRADLLRQDLTICRKTQFELVDDGDRRLRQTTVVEMPYLSQRGEPLALELEDFCEAVATRRPPLVDGASGLRALTLATRITEAAASAAGARSLTRSL